MAPRAKPRESGLAGRLAGGRVHESVLATLGARILSGHHRPGDILPREDELALMLGVSRTSLREAIKVLCAKGLLETRQRVGATVRPRSNWHLLDAAVLSWHPDIRGDAELIAGLLEARRIVEPAAAELAAMRATAADLARIEHAYLDMERFTPSDLERCCAADLAFHGSIVAASGNVVLKGLVGTIEAALRATFLITNTLTEVQAKALAAHREVVERIRFRDPPGAFTAMHRLLDIARENFDPVEVPILSARRLRAAAGGER